MDDYIKKTCPAVSISPASIKKDVNCIFRMYARHSANKSKSLTEESLGCPFSELGIIETVGDSPYHSFKIGPDEALYVGDSLVDYETARAAGVPFLSYKNKGLEADYHSDRLMDIADLLNSGNNSLYRR